MNDTTLEEKPLADMGEIFQDNVRFLATTHGVTIVGVIVLIINLLRIGGNRVVQGVDSVVALAAAAVFLVFALRVRERLKQARRTDLLWQALLLGFGWWALLEAIRLTVFFVSTAPRFLALNWLWALGYLPVFYGLYLRYVDLDTTSIKRQQQFLGGGLALGLLYVVMALLIPLVRGRAPSVSGGMAGLLYSLADLGLLFLLGSIILFYWKKFGGPWKYFAIAFGLKFLGEAVMQYPSNLGQGSLLSFANVFHYAWYGFAAYGLFMYDTVLAYQFKPAKPATAQENLTPNASALLFTDEDDNVIKTSANFRYVMRLPDSIAATGTPVSKVLGLSEETFQAVKNQLRRQGSVKKHVIEPSYFRAGHLAWVTIVGSSDQQKHFNGMNMVVQVLVEGVAGAGLTNEERALVENIFYYSGVTGEDSEKLLITYFNLHYKMLAGLAAQYEGSRRAAGLSNRVNQIAKQRKLLVHVLEQEINVTGDVKLEDLGKSISTLLMVARTYLSGLAGMEVVRQETDRLHRNADRSTRELIRKYNLARLG